MKRTIRRYATAATTLTALLTLAACASASSGTAQSSANGSTPGVAVSNLAVIKSHLVTPGVITASTTGQNPPGTYIDSETGQLTGYYVELCRDVAADMGLTIRFDQVPFADQLTGIQSGRFSALPPATSS